MSTIVFWVGAAIAVPILRNFGDQLWFHLDAWDFLANRSARDPSDLLESHNGHWTALPILEWRVLYRLFGLSYGPFQLAVIVSHIGVAAALREVMRRSGLPPVVSTALALIFLFFGSGWQNILTGFQTTMNGSVFFGLVHLLLADAPQPSRRKDAAGLAAGAAAVMCSGVGIPMVAAVGVAVLLSRGWRIALLHTVPLAALYGAWWFEYRRPDPSPPAPSLPDLLDSAQRGFRDVFNEISHLPGLGLVLLVATAIGVGYAWLSKSPRLDHVRLSSITGLLAASLLVYVAVSYERAGVLGVEYVAFQPRYAYLGAALLLPAIGLAITALGSRAWILGAATFLLVAVGVPGNVDELRGRRPTVPGPGAVLAVPEVVYAAELPPQHRLFGERFLTLGFLQSAAEAGRLPDSEPSDGDRALAEFALVLQQHSSPSITPVIDGSDGASRPCPALVKPATVKLKPGDSVRFAGAIRAHEVGAEPRSGIAFRSGAGNHLVAFGRPVKIRIAGVSSPANPSGAAQLCPRARPKPVLVPGTGSMTERDRGTAVVEVPITLSHADDKPVTVAWDTIDSPEPGTARPGIDYVAASGTITLAAGETEGFVPITVLGDTESEVGPDGGEQVLVRFHSPSSNAQLDVGAFGIGVGVVIDDD